MRPFWHGDKQAKEQLGDPGALHWDYHCIFALSRSMSLPRLVKTIVEELLWSYLWRKSDKSVKMRVDPCELYCVLEEGTLLSSHNSYIFFQNFINSSSEALPRFACCLLHTWWKSKVWDFNHCSAPSHHRHHHHHHHHCSAPLSHHHHRH